MPLADINKSIEDLERQAAEIAAVLEAYKTIARHESQQGLSKVVVPKAAHHSKPSAVVYGGKINEVRAACESFIIPFSHKDVTWAVTTKGSKLSGKEIRGAFNRLVQKGFLSVDTEGRGRRPTTYVVKK